jgi:hypothetical protein
MRALCAALVFVAAACSSGAPPASSTPADVSTAPAIDGGGNIPIDGGVMVQPPVTVTVLKNGSGSVISDPPGIDCGERCSAPFPFSSAVKLVATPARGFRFDGWWPLCAGSAECKFGLGSDETVYAIFAPEPLVTSAPAPECVGLLPGDPGDGVVALLPQPDCISGTSDDVSGTFALAYWGFTWGPTYPVWFFFSVRDGVATQIGDRVYGSDDAPSWISSQPSGFTFFLDDGSTIRRILSSYDDSGTRVSRRNLTTAPLHTGEYGAVVNDPSGGTAAFSTHDRGDGTFETVYQRFDKSGAAEVEHLVVDTGHLPVYSAAVDLDGNVLGISRSSLSGPQEARWFARDGRVLTDWFPISAQVRRATFLAEGGLALVEQTQLGTSEYAGMLRVPDTVPSPLPGWLAQRSANVYSVVRGGKAYATWGPSGTCGLRVEIVSAASGALCGCLSIPNVWVRTSVGRDGSVIVPQPYQQGEQCAYRLYPKLLR